MPSVLKHQPAVLTFSTKQLPILSGQERLVINEADQTVALSTVHTTGRRTIPKITLCHFPPGAFRGLVTLLLSFPEPASYARLAAAIQLPTAQIIDMLRSQSLAPLHSHEEYWHRHLTQVAARQGPEAVHRELKLVRRAVKDPGGVADLLTSYIFGWRVKVAYKQGYLLEAASALPCKAVDEEATVST